MRMIALLPLLIAAAPVPPVQTTQPRASRVATATVRIIRAERIEADPDPQAGKLADRQYRRRGGMPLTEFF